MSLAVTRVFRARWSAQIHDEWMRNVADDMPQILFEELEQCRTLMDRAVPDALIDGHEHLIERLTLPDPDDRHVLAAAIQGDVSLIVTFNLKDFPEAILDPLGIEAIHPDAFVVGLLETHRDAVLHAFKAQRARLKNPPLSSLELVSRLERCGLDHTAKYLRRFGESL